MLTHYIFCPSSAVLITHLAAAENRCEKLEGQLEQMKRMLPRAESTSLPNQEVNSEVWMSLKSWVNTSCFKMHKTL